MFQRGRAVVELEAAQHKSGVRGGEHTFEVCKQPFWKCNNWENGCRGLVDCWRCGDSGGKKGVAERAGFNSGNSLPLLFAATGTTIPHGPVPGESRSRLRYRACNPK